MASFEVEAAFVAAFWAACERGEREAADAMRLVVPDYLEHTQLGSLYALLAGRYAAGKPLPEAEAIQSLAVPRSAVAMEVWRAVVDYADTYVVRSSAGDLVRYGEIICQHWQARRQVAVLRDALERADRALEKPEIAKDVGRQTLQALTALFTARGQPHRSRAEILEMLASEQPVEEQIVLPWRRLERECGPWVAGDLIGLSGYSGTGKSSFAAALAFELASRGTPVIAFSTEMRERWVARALAARAGVRQFVAEKRQWNKATEEEKRAWRGVIEEAKDWPWEVVAVGSVTVEDIVIRARSIRRFWPGQTVLVVVDHMHRLDYGREEANKMVGRATKTIRDAAAEDVYGGLVFLLLYQPRKPEDIEMLYRPAAAYQIRGDSTVWNELDVHLSPFRAWVKTTPYQKNAWGTPKTSTDWEGNPVMAKPNGDGAKLDDEHIYVKIDKRRIGGEGPVIWLDFDYPTGRIFEAARPGEVGDEGEEAAGDAAG
jgi:hypothetical protein